MTETTRHPLFDRLAFASLVPALLLPVVAAVVAVIATSGRPSDGEMDDSINGLVIAVHLVVLLGSMTLNAWLMLRYPPSFSERALPRNLSILLATLYLLVVAWVVVIVAASIGGSSVLFGIAIASVSIAVCVAALVRRGHHSQVQARSSVGLTPVARALSIGYVVVGSLGLLAALVVQFSTDGRSSVGLLGGPAMWALIVLGLPWGWPLYVIGVVLTMAAESVLGEGAAVVIPVLLGLAVAANVAIAASIAWSPARRTAITNWFFKLTPSVLVAVEVPPKE